MAEMSGTTSANYTNGSVLVQSKSNIIFDNSFGIADRRFDLPISKESVYKVASITKAFTAVLILQLYEKGELDIHKTIDQYLTDFAGEAGAKVTIHHLLNHTSGMRQIDTISSIDHAFRYGLGYLQEPLTSDQLYHRFENDSLVNEPGRKWEYNNYEYMVLGKIIERLSNKTYEEVLKEKILDPLEMENSGMLRDKDIIKNLCSTYFSEGEGKPLINDLPVYMENWYASGAMYSTPHDLLKFSNALFNLELIKKETLDLMLERGLEEYGYGVWIRGTGENRRMERYGRIMGANAVWMEFLEKDMTIIILSNTNLTNLGEFALEIEKTQQKS